MKVSDGHGHRPIDRRYIKIIMPITETTLLSGPAAATFNGHTFFAHDGILVTPALEFEKADDRVDSDANGALDATVSDAMVMIRFTPSVPFADLAALYPHAQGIAGASLFGSADVPLVLTAANGARLTFHAVAIVEMPDLVLTNRGPVAGSVTFLARGARGLGLTMANRLVTLDTGSIPLPSGGTPQLADDFAITWGSAPWVNLRARDGVRVHFALKTREVLSDANALLDVTLEELAVEVRFTPMSPGGPAEADLVAALQLQGPGALPGRSLLATAAVLDIAGEHLFVRLPLAQLVRGELAFDAVRGRLGELRFVAERAVVGTVAEPLVMLTEGVPV
jgi:hypothetical protein